MALLNGKPIVLVNLFIPESAAYLLEKEQVTHLLAPDNIIHALLTLHKDHPGSNNQHKYTHWTHAGYGLFSSGLAGPIAEMRAKYTPQLYLTGLYGSSELLALLSAWNYADTRETQLTGGGGRLVPGIRVRVVDSNGVPIHGFGEENKGELEFCGYSTLKEYLGNPEAMKKNLRKESNGEVWFRSGDLGYLVPARAASGFPDSPTHADFDAGRASNSFIFLARIGDSLRLRGFLVDPSEIEGVLQKHPMVGSVQVVGLDLGVGKGDDAVAFVIPSDSAKGKKDKEVEDEILNWARPQLANYKVPARILLTDKFPTTNGPNGEKVQKAVLRKEAASRIGVPGSKL